MQNNKNRKIQFWLLLFFVDIFIFNKEVSQANFGFVKVSNGQTSAGMLAYALYIISRILFIKIKTPFKKCLTRVSICGTMYLTEKSCRFE